MRVVALLVAALLAAAVVVVPEPSQPLPEAPVSVSPAPYTVCALAESARRTTIIDLTGGEPGELVASVFSSGDIQATTELPVEAGGTATLDVAELTGIALAPVLIGIDDPTRKAAMTITGGDGVAVADCRPATPEPQILAGGTSTEGNSYTVLLANPFAGSATVDLQVASEVGAETDPALQGVVVPPRSVVSVDVGGILPGRQEISTAVLTRSGRIVPGAVLRSTGDIAATSAVEPALDWYVVFPSMEGVGANLVLHNPGTSEVPFQLDVYSENDVVEAAYEDVVPAQSQTVLSAADYLEGPGVLRVVAGGPLGAGSRFVGDPGAALIPGIPEGSPIWQIPGAGRAGAAVAHIFNTAVEEATVRLLDAAGEEVEAIAVPSGTLVSREVAQGWRIEADAEIVVTWTTVGDGFLVGAAGGRPQG